MPSTLNHEELEKLTGVWESWANESKSPRRFVGRARMRLFFLLARYAGLRSSEIFSFSEQAALDSQTGLLQLKDRKLFLPPVALRPIRRILSLPEASDKDFLRIDPGFLRRTFYEMARKADLKPEACAPRALRLARALEMLEGRAPMRLVISSLGITNPLNLARLAAERLGSATSANRFPALLVDMFADYRSAKLFLRLAEEIILTSILDLGELSDIEPAHGKPLVVFIPPGLVFPSQVPLPMENCLSCEIISLARDSVESRMRLRVQAGIELLSIIDSSLWDENFKPGANINAYIPARALKINGD